MGRQEFVEESHLDMNRIRRENRTEYDQNDGLVLLSRLKTTEEHFRELYGSPTVGLRYVGVDYEGWRRSFGYDYEKQFEETITFYTSHFKYIHRYVVDHELKSRTLADRLFARDTDVKSGEDTYKKRYDLLFYPVGTLERFIVYEVDPPKLHPEAMKPGEIDEMIAITSTLGDVDVSQAHMLDDLLGRTLLIGN